MTTLRGLDSLIPSGDKATSNRTQVNGPGASSWRDLAQARADPLMQMDWDVQFNPPAGVTPLAHEFVEEIHVPMPKFESDSVTFQARKYYYAKFEEFGVASLKLFENNRMAATKFIRAWQGRIKDSRGNYRVPSEYKGSITVWPRDSKQSNIARVELHGVFPTQTPQLDYTSSGERSLLDGVEFSVDDVKIFFLY
jgi:hypothetical protein